MPHEVVFLKLGGSLITDKRGVESVRQDNLENVSEQISEALRENSSLKGNFSFVQFISSNRNLIL